MKKEIVLTPIILVASLFLYFFLIPQIPVWSSDEGRFAEIAREMWLLGDFVVSHFNYVDYLEKPVLAPIFTSLFFELFGDNNLTARLVPICSGLFGLGLTYYFSRKFFSKRVALFSVCVLLTTVGYTLVGRFAVIDMLMTALISGAIFFLMSAYFEEKTKHYFIAYVFIGLSFLTKGLIGALLPGLIFLSFLIWQRDLREIRRMQLGKGFLIVALIILPWFVLISLREPEFFRVFIMEHHFSRFLSKGFGRVRPFWFFIPIFFATAFPWTLFLPAAFLEARKLEGFEKAKVRFLICWILTTLIFFSLPKSKLPYYLLPLSIPLAIFIGRYISAWCERELGERKESLWVKGVIPFFAVIGIVGAGVMNLYLQFFEVDPQAAIIKSQMRAGSFVLLMGSGLLLFLFRKNKRAYAFGVMAGMVYVILLLIFKCMLVISPFQSTYEEARIMMAENLTPQDSVAVFSSPDQFSDLPFHLKRRIVVIGSNRGTLERESRESDDVEKNRGWFLNLQEFSILFNSGEKRIFALMKADDFQRLLESGIKNYWVISQSANKTLIVNKL